MNLLKGKFLLKLHNCLKCHKNSNIIPKIINQYSFYILWSFNQYNIKINSKIFQRNNFIMKSQIKNISLNDIINIIKFLNDFY